MKEAKYINWDDVEAHILVNPKDPNYKKIIATFEKLPYLHSHIWLMSSGSTQKIDMVTLYAIRKSSFLLSARAVNLHINAAAKDIWLNVLPVFHAGGLAIYARAHLSRSKVVDHSNEEWSAQNFINAVEKSSATLTSLVPTQLYDLVQSGLKMPKSLRAINIGGAKLDLELYLKAQQMGYPVLPSYGMTECASQIATAPLSTAQGSKKYPSLQILPHMKVSKIDGRIAVQSKALFTVKVVIDLSANEIGIEDELEMEDATSNVQILKRVGDWYVSQDIGFVTGNEIVIEGRSDQAIKISGEMVNLANLNEIFRDISQCHNSLILSREEIRRGNELCLVLPLSSYSRSQEWVKKYNEKVLPVAKLSVVYFLKSIPLTDLKKVKIQEVKVQLGL